MDDIVRKYPTTYRHPETIDVTYDSEYDVTVIDLSYRFDTTHSSAVLNWRIALTTEQAADLRKKLNGVP